MSEKCKYCDYVSKCSRFCEYNSIMCLMHRSFPKIVDKTYEELEKENQELKKQLHEASLQIQSLIEEDMSCPSNCSKLRKLRNQQKEFIEWLENKLNMCDGFLDTIKSDLEEISYAGRVSGKTYIATQIMKNEIAMKCYEEVLSKYKEIIGDIYESDISS